MSVTSSDQSGNVFRLSTIFVIRADGSGLQQLTGGKQYDAHPVWAP